VTYALARLTYRTEVDVPELVPSREMILALEEEMRKLPPGEAPVTHHFCEGVYAREMFIPKGTMLTGKIHRFAHINIISKGDITVLTEHGMKRIKAPCTLISQPGIKRAGYAHEDTVWTTIHPTHETDLEKLEEHFIAKDFSEFPQVEADKLCLK
jgi:hypothetical protein